MRDGHEHQLSARQVVASLLRSIYSASLMAAISGRN
jgi:hypothetical protein